MKGGAGGSTVEKVFLVNDDGGDKHNDDDGIDDAQMAEPRLVKNEEMFLLPKAFVIDTDR